MSDAQDAEGSARDVADFARADQDASATAEPATAAVDDTLGPLAPDLRTVFQGGTFILLLLAACYGAAEIILPIVVAFVLMLVLQPAVRFFQQWHIPRGLAAVLLIVLLFGTLGGFGTVLSGPAANWAEKVPAGIPKLEERLRFLSKPVTAAQQLVVRAENLGSQVKPLAVTVQGNRLSDRLLSGTRSVISGVLETVLVLFFLLVSGETFLRRLVEVLPHFKNKRQAVDISQQIESDIAAYLVTITLMNAVVGVATGIVAAACSVGDPVLWGTLAFLLNYVPIIGPMIGVVVFLLVGLLSIDTLWVAFLPAGLYLGIHMIEGETVTPMLLARRFTVNPVLVVVALVFWYWMWGVPGAILATPMLAVTKIICDRVQSLAAFGHFIEG
jgi:predicted PurR-regulated permease PerM